MNSLSNSEDLMDHLLDNLLEVNNLLLDNRLLWSWGSLIFLSENNDFLVNNMNLLDGLLDSLLEYSDNTSSDWSSLDWPCWVSNRNNSSLNSVNLRDILVNNISENSDLSSNNWSLWKWSNNDLFLKNSDGLSNLSDLLSNMGDLLVEYSNNLLGDWGQWNW